MRIKSPRQTSHYCYCGSKREIEGADGHDRTDLAPRHLSAPVVAVLFLAIFVMPAFLYRCPATGQHVQGFVGDEPTENEDSENEFAAFSCPACTALHWINPKTGKVLGRNED